MGEKVFTGQDVETLRRQLNAYRRNIDATLLGMAAAQASLEAALETVDTDTTLSMIALEDEVLVADATGGLVGHADLTYDETTLYVPGLNVADNAQIDGSLAVDVDVDVVGTMTAATVVADVVDLDGTETDELVDIDRVIDANVTKDAITITEVRSGVIAADGHAGVSYKSTVNGTYAGGHIGLRSEIDHTAGGLGVSYPFFAKMGSAGSCGFSQLYGGVMALDGASMPGVPIFRSGIGIGVHANSADNTYGCYTQVENEGTGIGAGFRGYGKNNSAGTDLNAIGLWGYAQSANGLEAGVFGIPWTKDAKGFGFVGEGHNHFSDGVTWLHISDGVAEVVNKTHINETDDGSLWIENKLEVVEAAYLDSTLEVDGQADFNDNVVIDKELKGGRCLLTAGSSSSNTVSVYLKTPGGITMSTTRGYLMARGGDIIGIAGQLNIASASAGAKAFIDVMIASAVLATVEFDYDELGAGYHNLYQTTTRVAAAAPFSAGDVLSFRLRIQGTLTAQYPCGVAELQFDT